MIWITFNFFSQAQLYCKMNCLPRFASFCDTYFQSDTECVIHRHQHAKAIIAMRFPLLLITKIFYLVNSVYPMAQSCKCTYNINIQHRETDCYSELLCCSWGKKKHISVSSLVTETFSFFEIVISEPWLGLCNLEAHARIMCKTCFLLGFTRTTRWERREWRRWPNGEFVVVKTHNFVIISLNYVLIIHTFSLKYNYIYICSQYISTFCG